ncbi:MAG: nucleoside monophosphate kinase [Candidatus Diapherotrites archaeon]|nr:nucleoside monophosphate kinase [Candidatus Diapherotrites archaeon]
MNLVLMGPPGSGKGTIAQLLTKKGWVHFSTGQALRDHAARKGKFAARIDTLLSKGHLASDAITYHVLQENLSRLEGKNVLFDGFPRNLAQGKGARTRLNPLGMDFDAFIFLEVSTNEVVARLANRRQCAMCGRVYGKQNPSKKVGVCDADGGKLIRRDDDKPAVIRERFRVYRTQTLPLLDWAAERYPVFEVNGKGSPTTVFKRVVRLLDNWRTRPKKKKGR